MTTLAVAIGGVVAVAVGTVGALIILVAWFRERRVVSQSTYRSAEQVKELVGQERAADILDIESGGMKLTEAMSTLIRSLADTGQAVIQIGDTILIKDANKVTVRSLKPRELRYLERHPRLFESPSEVLKALGDPTSPLRRHSAQSLSHQDRRRF